MTNEMQIDNEIIVNQDHLGSEDIDVSQFVAALNDALEHHNVDIVAVEGSNAEWDNDLTNTPTFDAAWADALRVVLS